jgi:hypothetical protein
MLVFYTGENKLLFFEKVQNFCYSYLIWDMLRKRNQICFKNLCTKFNALIGWSGFLKILVFE